MFPLDVHIQVSSLGIDFNYKHEYRRALVHCMAQTFTTIFIVIIYHSIVIISKLHLLKVLLNHVIFGLLLDIALTAISTSFIAFLLNLKTRYAALNTHLRLTVIFALNFEFTQIEIEWFFSFEGISQNWKSIHPKKMQSMPSNLLDVNTRIWRTSCINWIIVTHFRLEVTCSLN